MHVPGWHEATAHLQEQGKVKMVGIIQEQHPDRADLFMQWKQMDWPILVDALNLLGVSVVPITLLIDEFGVIVKINPHLSNAEKEMEAFLGIKGPNIEGHSSKTENKALPTAPASAASFEHGHANNLILWGSPEDIDDAISVYKKELSEAPDSGSLHFRLGVAYRMRYDLLSRQFEDFQSAVEYWVKALETNPNQYIWRRRIQQYGPRLDKPYPFYDWIPTARRDIRKRGEEPAALLAEPGGAEYAQPSRRFDSENILPEDPDPEGRITRDFGRFITVRSVVVPSTNRDALVSRIHIQFTPNIKTKTHWNNEVDDLVLWVDPPKGWVTNSKRVTTVNPKSAVSDEVRTIEFELKALQGYGTHSTIIPTYALYYVCEDLVGTCLYRRQDIPVELDLE